MSNNREVHYRDAPKTYLENVTTSAIPFTDPEIKCRECDGRFHPDDVEAGTCPSCESTDIVDDEIGAIDFDGEEFGGPREVCRVLIRRTEAADFFESLDRTLATNFGVRLTATDACDDETTRRLRRSGT